MRIVTAKPATLGELIQYHRQRKNISLSKLQELVGLDKGNLSRIENGEVKRPNFNIIESIAAVLDIPSEDIVEQYIEIGHKSNVIYAFLQKAVAAFYSPSLITKIATKYLESPKEDTLDLIENLYQMTDSLEDTSIQLSLYSLIIDYSRAHGIMPYIAKGLYQKYMIERDDFSRLNETYTVGRAILNYADFLSHDERITFYYKLGCHAYVLRLYEDCIELCSNVIRNDKADSFLKAEAFYALCNSYYYLGDAASARYYLDEYSKFSFPHVIENIKFMTGSINGKLGNIDLAITQLEDCLKNSSEYNFVYIAVSLFELYLQKKDFSAIEKLLSNEEKIANMNIVTPFRRYILAYFYKLKGDFLMYNNVYIATAFEYYAKGAHEYMKVNMYTEAFECYNCISMKLVKLI
ncbi:helix-turn-helix domain-containing protein [Paenibacillus alvei]|uniref:Helix-turn-helix domain-containing protein n=1 Tax=Paenibacillus alvei TaxID=44250 RepID=A0ABT4H4A1_PAEAL|nr:helix-turn-helix domain-containing protein [Paenibacillus alvei]MCY9763817.1 helix-turn-helix domain-containing protein [Paenibacillus alvei]MCY9765299.1 helix-turn-helix domain-containing protein [Paenibacillus alvei]